MLGHLLSLPFRLVGWVLDMTGHLVGFVLGLVLLVVGIVLCMTVVGLIAGIPLCNLGAVMMFKSLFVCHRNDR